jgi:hypothetical protein
MSFYPFIQQEISVLFELKQNSRLIIHKSHSVVGSRLILNKIIN